MNRLRALSARLTAHSTQITLLMIGLSGLFVLYGAVDLVFRHLLQLPKDVAAYLSALSIGALSAIGWQRWSARARAAAESTTNEEEN